MQIDIHPWRYHVRVCPGPLYRDGVEIDAITHGREILLSGEIKSRHRIEALLDQLYHLHLRHRGPFTPESFAGFVTSVMRQLLHQGGEPALRRLAPSVPAEMRRAA